MAYLKDNDGRDSLMRLLAFMGFILGGGLAIAGVIGLFAQIPQMQIPVLAGTGLASGGEVLKAVQKKFEAIKV